ncbi:zf-HC2 domain-containing protein [candidate division KSB1 bacterium]|nr:zf-HC2 domain-containing protein [candidate division KSB1 bacterium]
MKSNSCPTAKLLILYFDDQLSDLLKKQITDHLKECEKCKTHIKTLHAFEKFEGKTNNTMNDSTIHKQEGCIQANIMYQYLEGTLSDSEKHDVEHHLSTCDACLNEITSLVRNAYLPMSEQEMVDIEKIRNTTSEQQVEKIISYIRVQKETEPDVLVAENKTAEQRVTKLTNKLKAMITRFFSVHNFRKPAIAFALVLIIATGIYSTYRYYRINYPINQAEQMMLANHRTFIEDARLSGGYGSSGISMLMAPEDESDNYLKSVKADLLTAIKHGATSDKAKLLLAQVFIIERSFNQADSILNKLKADEPENAAVFNDIGVFYFEQRDWEAAANYFERALTLNDRLLEAYFNLALSKLKLNNPDAALLALNNYLTYETDEAWKNAALRLKNNIIKNKDG